MAKTENQNTPATVATAENQGGEQSGFSVELKTQMEAELAALRAQLKEKEEAEKTLVETNVELQKQLADSEAIVEMEKVVVSSAGKKYQVVAPTFYHDQKRYEAKDLKNNPELVKLLVSKKSGILKAL